MGVMGDGFGVGRNLKVSWHSMRATVKGCPRHARQQRATERNQPSSVPKRTSPPGDPWTAKLAGRPADHTSNAAIWATAADRYRVEAVAEASESDDQGHGVHIRLDRQGTHVWLRGPHGRAEAVDLAGSIGTGGAGVVAATRLDW